jgi:hypothetical protein
VSDKHECVLRINAYLAKHNTQISSGISFSNQDRELIQIATCKVDASKRGRPVTFWASFCPFCGNDLAPGREGEAK